MVEPKILLQTQGLVVVDKPSGYTVHNEEPSVQSWALNSLKWPQCHFPLRLDKETSGLLPILREGSDVEAFREQISDKTYVTLLRGQMKLTYGEWASPMSDKAEGRKNPLGMSRDRVPARTKFRVLESNRYFTLVECQLLTGRQHQIRKHAAHAGHPTVGDARYNDPNYNRKIISLYKHERLFLHCLGLQFSWKHTSQNIHAMLPDCFTEVFTVKAAPESSG